MVYTFARVNAVLKMKVRDFFVQGRRGWGCGCTKKAARSMNLMNIISAAETAKRRLDNI